MTDHIHEKYGIRAFWGIVIVVIFVAAVSLAFSSIIEDRQASVDHEKNCQVTDKFEPPNMKTAPTARGAFLAADEFMQEIRNPNDCKLVKQHLHEISKQGYQAVPFKIAVSITDKLEPSEKAELAARFYEYSSNNTDEGSIKKPTTRGFVRSELERIKITEDRGITTAEVPMFWGLPGTSIRTIILEHSGVEWEVVKLS